MAGSRRVRLLDVVEIFVQAFNDLRQSCNPLSLYRVLEGQVGACLGFGTSMRGALTATGSSQLLSSRIPVCMFELGSADSMQPESTALPRVAKPLTFSSCVAWPCNYI